MSDEHEFGDDPLDDFVDAVGEADALRADLATARRELEEARAERDRLRDAKLDRWTEQQKRLDAALAVLREVEWGGTNVRPDQRDWRTPCCPVCRLDMPIHQPDCRLASLLASSSPLPESGT